MSISTTSKYLRYLLIATIASLTAFAATSVYTANDNSSGSHELAQGRLVAHALKAVERNYLEPDRIEPLEMLKGALEHIERLIPEVLVTYDNERSATVTVGVAAKKFRIGNVSSISDLGQVLTEVLAFIDTHYNGTIEKNDIEYAAIDGMLAELDPHSSFLTPKVYKEFRIGTIGTFGGLGIVISIRDGNLTVISPLEGTPAWRVGIKAGDQIIQIGDESTINMSLTDAVNKLRGKVGTAVRIVVARPGRPKSFPVTITRAVINIDSVQKLLLSENGKRIGYIKIKNFQANTNNDFIAALNEFHAGGSLDGLIVDVRNNPGGLLDQAVDIADHFLSDGTVVKTVASRGTLMDMETAHADDVEPAYPLVVLINEGSASASEIVAGALKANDRAIIMGHRSFGKGSVQTIFEIGNDSAIKLTIAQYLPAGTMSIQSVGVTPDIELVPTTVVREKVDLVDDVVQSETDLEKHLENSGKKTEEPIYRARFYQPYDKEGDGSEDADFAARLREYTVEPDVKDDFAVQLAKRLLTSVSSPSRDVMLKEIKVPLATSHEEQQAVILKRLAALDVDWSSAPTKEKSLLQIAYNLRHNGSIVKAARAGWDVELELIATNVGKGVYSQLVAVGQSEFALLKNREFVFGKLKPGQQRSWRVPLTIPESMPTQDITMSVDFREEHGNVPDNFNIIIPLQGNATPRFAFSYHLQERGTDVGSGRTLHLVVNARNVGKGTSSKETVMTLGNKSGEGVFIQSGRAVLGAMPPQGSRTATFLFRTSKQFADPTIDLELTILDPKMLIVLNKEFSVEDDGGTLKPPERVLYQPPAITLTDVMSSTRDKRYSLTGHLSDTDSVRDFFIFVGDKKVAYVPNALKTNVMALSADLPLEEGNNIIAIAARDMVDLTERKVIVIKRIKKDAS